MQFKATFTKKNHLTQFMKNLWFVTFVTQHTEQSKFIKYFSAVHEGEKTFICTLNDLRFISKKGVELHLTSISIHEGKLKEHIKIVHEGQKPYKCTLCD